MGTREAQVRSIHNVYTATCMVGGTKPLVKVSESDFQQDFERDLHVALPSDDKAVLAKCAQYRSAALKAAREGKNAIADYLFSATEKLLSPQKLAPVSLLLALSAHEAAVSYLDYRRQEFEVGTARIYRSLTIDEELEHTYGYSQYHIHRIRLLLNLVRLKRRQGEIAEAFRMSALIVDYLEQKTSVLPFPTSWDSRHLESVSFFQKNFLFEQAIFEIVCMVVGQEGVPALFLQSFASHLCAEGATDCQLSPRSHRWLQARQALQSRQIDGYLEIIQPLIAEGPDAALYLWYGVLMDLAQVCAELPLEQAHFLAEDITRDMSSWPWSRLPPSWKHRYAQERMDIPLRERASR